ncbi:MAG: glycosyl transferase family 2 [Chloroflexi bacterium]|nr:MAG: glycosyl transferase family 2 [Chloroflexota bacterium]
MSISILLLTLNEEANLPACLGSVEWSNDIVVLDSFSSDKTCEIAERLGARVIQRSFDNWASHQNWAMEHISFKHEWVFYLDADERMTDSLKQELLAVASNRTRPEVAYYCGRKNYFMGKWIRHAMPPGAIMRFFQPKHVRFERLVNPTPIIDGVYGYLENYLEHYNFSKGLTEWFTKHNRYSTWEALEGHNLLANDRFAIEMLFQKDRYSRRQTLKRISLYLPLRPLLKFAYLYIVNKGFLDGRPGLQYCLLQTSYEYMIVIKQYELRRRQLGLPV